MQSKGKQWIPEGKHLLLSLPGGGGYGESAQRDRSLVEQDLLRGYIGEDEAKRVYAYKPD